MVNIFLIALLVSKSMKDYNKSSFSQLGIIKRGLDNIRIAGIII
jgi:hypothetical protein